jgi:putative polysaccharide biosynthesis protein
VLLSHGRPDLQVRWTAYALVFSIIYFVIGMPWGLEGVAGAQAIFEVGGWMVRHTMANRILNLSWRQFARSLSPLWIAHGIYVLVVIALRQMLVMLLPATVIRLPVGVFLSTAAYFIIIRLALPGLLTTLGKGVLESFAHGVARTAGVPSSVQTSDAPVA